MVKPCFLFLPCENGDHLLSPLFQHLIDRSLYYPSIHLLKDLKYPPMTPSAILIQAIKIFFLLRLVQYAFMVPVPSVFFFSCVYHTAGQSQHPKVPIRSCNFQCLKTFHMHLPLFCKINLKFLNMLFMSFLILPQTFFQNLFFTATLPNVLPSISHNRLLVILCNNTISCPVSLSSVLCAHCSFSFWNVHPLLTTFQTLAQITSPSSLPLPHLN